MFSKQLVGLVGLGLSVFAVACSSAPADDSDTSTGAATASACNESATTACTPAPGSELRKGISDLLRFSISSDLAKNGVEPGEADVKFVFSSMLIQNSHIWASAKIMRGDGATPFDMRGTKYEGMPNTVQSLMEVESGSEFSHAIGISLEQSKFACDFVKASFDGQAPGMYKGDMNSACDALKAVDDCCFVDYTHGAGECNTSSGDNDTAFDKCLAPVKKQLTTCCTEGGTSECMNP